MDVLDALENYPPSALFSIAILGCLGLNLTSKAVSHLYKTFLRPGKDLKKLGKWAVVTGATGKGYDIITYEMLLPRLDFCLPTISLCRN
jgi:hypothetical protein